MTRGGSGHVCVPAPIDSGERVSWQEEGGAMHNEHGRLIARAGIILLAVGLINGFLVHALSLQRQALAAHLIALIGSSLLFGLGALWPRLRLSPAMSKAGLFLAIYGFGAGWLVNFSTAVTGAFGIFPIAVASSGGTSAADAVVSTALLSVALALFLLSGVVFWGLRGASSPD